MEEALLSNEEKSNASKTEGTDRLMAKYNAQQKIESHEKLCRIMQKQTHDKILKLETQINRVESILLVSMGALIYWDGLYYFFVNVTIKIMKLSKNF